MVGRLRDRLYRPVYERLGARRFDGRSESGLVTFTFDDFPATALDSGGALLERFGWRATYYASGGLLGLDSASGRLATVRELDDGIARGHEIGNHSFSHSDCSKTSEKDFIEDCHRGSQALASYDAKNFAYPFGAMTPRVQTLLGRTYDSCRGIEAGINGRGADLNGLRANAVYSSRGLSDAEQLVERNRSERGWLIFYTHDVRDTPSRFGVNPADFERLAKAVLDTGMPVLTVKDAILRLGVSRRAID